jgi:hypothetical protein
VSAEKIRKIIAFNHDLHNRKAQLSKEGVLYPQKYPHPQEKLFELQVKWLR